MLHKLLIILYDLDVASEQREYIPRWYLVLGFKKPINIQI